MSGLPDVGSPDDASFPMNSPEDGPTQPPTSSPPASLTRQVSVGSALSLKRMKMIVVGPCCTRPLVVIARGGPQAMLGWVLGALIANCDGLVWAELGAMKPQAGG